MSPSVILLPVLIVVLYALYRTLRRRSLSKRSLDTLLALVLLAYFLATSALGIFWVARQELPVFDLHYLLGYVTLALVLVHVALNWSVITSWFRGLVPGASSADNRKTRPLAVSRLSKLLGLALFGGACFWLGRQPGSREITILTPGKTPASSPSPTASQPARETAADGGEAPPTPAYKPEYREGAILDRQLITAEEHERPLADYYHEETKHSPYNLFGGGLDFSTQPDVFKTYPQATKITLPEPAAHADISVVKSIDGARRPVAAFQSRPVSLQDLSTMLFLTNGVTSTLSGGPRTYYLRAAPSAGALYPTDTYLVVQNVDGLDPGLYHYAVQKHSLHRLRTDQSLTEQFASLTPQPHYVRQAPVTFIYTSVFFRSSWKYKERAYRYCGLDAGHLAVQTHLAAQALGLAGKLIGRFDDAKVNALLELDENQEGCLLLLPVGSPDEKAAPVEHQFEFVAAPQELDVRKAPLISLIHGRTCLARGENQIALWPMQQLPEKSYDRTELIALPSPDGEGDDLFATIRRRRSIRNWHERAMTLPELSLVLYSSFGIAKPGQSPDPTVAEGQALHLYVLANNVADLEAGVYYYLRPLHSLAPIHKGDLHRRAGQACLGQEVVEQAQAVLIMTVDAQRLGFPDGDRGYRYAALEAGMWGGRTYLQTTAINMGCCGIGAYFDDRVSRLIKADPEQELVIYIAAIGTRFPDSSL